MCFQEIISRTIAVAFAFLVSALLVGVTTVPIA